jgi:hypothetical protein
MTLLSISQDVLDEIGIIHPPRIFGSEDETARRIRACAKAAGENLYRQHAWSILHREHEFTTLAGEDNYPVPEDFGRPQQDAAWDRTSFRKARAGLTASQWQTRRSALVPMPGLWFHIRWLIGPLAGSALLDPVPGSSGTTLVYEYVSKFFIQDELGVPKAAFTADTDECRLENEIFRRELLWRIKRAFGQAYADERHDAESIVRGLVISDMALEPGNLAPCQVPWPYPNIPEGSWNQ